MSELTERVLNRSTLVRQMLTRRDAIRAADAIQRIGAIQAQAPASPYLALAARIQDFDPVELDQAIAGAEVVKATLMRITLHLVHAGDLRPMHEGMQHSLRAGRIGDRRVAQTGLTPAQIDHAVTELLPALQQPHGNAEGQRALDPFVSGAEQATWAWWAIRQSAPLRHAPTGGPWSFGLRPQFVASGHPPLIPYDQTRSDQALRVLIERYLAAFGPASVADVAQFAMVQRSRARSVIEAMSDELRRHSGPAGVLYDAPGAELPDADLPVPVRLLPMWDSVLLAYHDRSRVLPEDLRRIVIRTGGDVLPSVLVDGYVAGVWRPLADGADVAIEVTALRPFTAAQWREVQAEADLLRPLLRDREAEPYRRYHRWWAQLPTGEVRRL